MRKIKLSEEPVDTTSDRKAWLDCTKVEMVFAIEQLGQRIATLEDKIGRREDMLIEREAELRKRSSRLREAEQFTLDTFSEFVGMMFAHVSSIEDKTDKIKLASAACRQIEWVLTSVTGETLLYEKHVNSQTRVWFRQLCSMAYYLPRPHTAGGELFAIYEEGDPDYDKRWHDMDWYEVRHIQDDLLHGRFVAPRFAEETVSRRVSKDGYAPTSVYDDALEEDHGI